MSGRPPLLSECSAATVEICWACRDKTSNIYSFALQTRGRSTVYVASSIVPTSHMRRTDLKSAWTPCSTAQACSLRRQEEEGSGSIAS